MATLSNKLRTLVLPARSVEAQRPVETYGGSLAGAETGPVEMRRFTAGLLKQVVTMLDKPGLTDDERAYLENERRRLLDRMDEPNS